MLAPGDWGSGACTQAERTSFSAVSRREMNVLHDYRRRVHRRRSAETLRRMLVSEENVLLQGLMKRGTALDSVESGLHGYGGDGE